MFNKFADRFVQQTLSTEFVEQASFRFVQQICCFRVEQQILLFNRFCCSTGPVVQQILSTEWLVNSSTDLSTGLSTDVLIPFPMWTPIGPLWIPITLCGPLLDPRGSPMAPCGPPLAPCYWHGGLQFWITPQPWCNFGSLHNRCPHTPTKGCGQNVQ